MMIPLEREILLDLAAECEAEAGKAATGMLAQKRRMQLLRQRAIVLRELAGREPGSPEPPAAL